MEEMGENYFYKRRITAKKGQKRPSRGRGKALQRLSPLSGVAHTGAALKYLLPANIRKK